MKVFIHFITGWVSECEVSPRSREAIIDYVKSHYDLAFVRYITFGDFESSDKVYF